MKEFDTKTLHIELVLYGKCGMGKYGLYLLVLAYSYLHLHNKKIYHPGQSSILQVVKQSDLHVIRVLAL